jgi:large subunit ribosomal protein L20
MRDEFIGRKQKKRQFRRLWIVRIAAALKPTGLSYSRFIHGLSKAGVDINRKMLSELAIHDRAAFDQVVEQARAAL